MVAAIQKHQPQITIIDPASVSAVAQNAFSAETNDNPLTQLNTAGFFGVGFQLYASAGVAFTAGSLVNLYYQMRNIVGSNDAPSPIASYPEKYAVNFKLNASTGVYLPSNPVYWALPPLPSGVEIHFQVENKDAQSLALNGWGLYATPMSPGT